ncbi:E1-E2 ATPase-domain-containing protein [Mycena galopus ATCC 62051]|nr:E1-E2 ATPase-domain-containing protein [Mycena galopus ATCC 62051]
MTCACCSSVQIDSAISGDASGVDQRVEKGGGCQEQGPEHDNPDVDACEEDCCSPAVGATSDLEIRQEGDETACQSVKMDVVTQSVGDSECSQEDECCGKTETGSKLTAAAACQQGCCSSTVKMDTATQSAVDVDCSQEDEGVDVLCAQECCTSPVTTGDGAEGKTEAATCQQGCCSSIVKMDTATQSARDGDCSQEEKGLDVCAQECCSSPVTMGNGAEEKTEAATCQQGCCSSTVKMDTATQSARDVDCSQEEEGLDACAQECCSPPSKMGDGTEGKTEGGSDKDDDDSLCPCCIEILVQHPEAIGRTLIETESACPALFPKNSAHRLSAAVRQCCRRFELFCAQKPCCFPLAPSLRKGPTVPVSVPSACKQPVEPVSPKYASDNLAHLSSSKSTGEPLKLEITGMDCADCCIKVSRALSRLPSVTQVHLDYIEASASLVYDPEVITPEAIARYVARATGFTILAVGKEHTRPTNHLTLPLTFSRPPPARALALLNPRHRSELRGGFTEISFPIRGNEARQPRQVLADLAQYGPALLPINALSKIDDRAAKDLRRIALRTLAIVLLAIPVLLLAWAPLPGNSFAHGLASVVLTTLIQVAAFPILSSSVRSIVFTHAVDMSVLVSVSSLSAWIFSMVAFALAAAGNPFAEPFFETVALLVALVHIGRLVQAATRRATSSAIRELQRLQPEVVILVEKVGESTIETKLDARLLYYGDIVRLGPASRIPTDGMIVAGSSAVDESSVTGESLPCAKQVGSSVTAGTLNLDGEMDMQITQLIHENYLVRVTSLVRQAQATRSPFQDLADRFSAVVLPISTGCSVIAFVVWFLVNRYGKHLSATPSVVSALTYALAILIVSCPCAISVAVPLAVTAALRAGRREGVLFRSSEALQRAHDVDVVVFDKTGTLSRGVFSLERKELLAHGVDKIIHPLISSNEHPISKAVLAHVSPNVSRLPDSSVPGITSLPGMGISATLAGYPLLAGNPTFTGAVQHPFIQEFTTRGLTLFTVTLAGELVAAFGLADTPRADAATLLEALAARGKRVFVLSGDNAGAVARFAAMLPIQPADAQAACTPAGKAEFVKGLQARGQRVCFVGDGTNDAPALAQADVALCVVAGADVAVAAAGALVAGESMRRGVLGALDVAKHAQQHMVVALGWCVLYNAAALLFAGGAFVWVRIEPQWAGLGELVSLVPVLVVGLALDLRWRWHHQ